MIEQFIDWGRDAQLSSHPAYHAGEHFHFGGPAIFNILQRGSFIGIWNVEQTFSLPEEILLIKVDSLSIGDGDHFSKGHLPDSIGVLATCQAPKGMPRIAEDWFSLTLQANLNHRLCIISGSTL